MNTAVSSREVTVMNMIKNVLNEYILPGYHFVLFGSRARKSSKARSDFDIGILGDKPLDNKTFFNIQDALEDLSTLHKIDLVDLQKVSDSFREEALKDYIILL